MEVNEVQMLQFKLMIHASFNVFNSEQVVHDLLEHKDLWRGAVMWRADYFFDEKDLGRELINLSCLRDIEDGHWNVDTLYILGREGKEEELEKLAREWDADEISWITGEDADRMLGIGGYLKNKILRIWWD